MPRLCFDQTRRMTRTRGSPTSPKQRNSLGGSRRCPLGRGSPSWSLTSVHASSGNKRAARRIEPYLCLNPFLLATCSLFETLTCNGNLLAWFSSFGTQALAFVLFTYLWFASFCNFSLPFSHYRFYTSTFMDSKILAVMNRYSRISFHHCFFLN